MAYIMSPVISLKEPVENFGCGRGSFREPFRGEVGDTTGDLPIALCEEAVV